MSWIPVDDPDAAPGVEPEYEDWPIEADDDRHLVGTTDAKPAFFNPVDRAIHLGRVDEESEELIPEDEPEWELAPAETVGEALERIGRGAGWEWLSEFAREHVEPDEEQTAGESQPSDS